MTEYNCPRCGYYTTYKSHFANHVYRKKTCKPIYSDISISLIIEEYGLEKKKLAKNNKKIAKNNTDEKIKIICTYCGKDFNNKRTLNNHLSKCKEKYDL